MGVRAPVLLRGYIQTMEEAAAQNPAAKPAETTFCPEHARRFVLISAILASSMGFIDGAVVSLAMPAIRADLGATLADAQWIINSYLLFLSALVLLGGAAGDVFGVRNIFAFGIVVFVITSLACAVAPNAEALIAMRAAQGVGAALMIPGSLAIIAKSKGMIDGVRYGKERAVAEIWVSEQGIDSPRTLRRVVDRKECWKPKSLAVRLQITKKFAKDLLRRVGYAQAYSGAPWCRSDEPDALRRRADWIEMERPKPRTDPKDP